MSLNTNLSGAVTGKESHWGKPGSPEVGKTGSPKVREGARLKARKKEGEPE
ncbi:MAG TPA: hypothetical protein VHC50_12020 [Puia sp.]|nr:hypothetical protein [Puia sp.]